MNVSIGGIAKTVEITSFDKLGDVKVCMLTTTADGSVGFQQLNDEVRDTIYASFPVDTSKGDIASFEDGADNVALKSLIANITPIQSGSGDPSPTNIRPISGHTEVNVYRTGVNVWDEEWEVGAWNASTGEAETANDRIRSKNFIPVMPNTEYYYGWSLRVVFYDANKGYVGYKNYGAPYSITTPSNCYYIKFNGNAAYGTTYNNDISINYPSTDTEYHAYAGQTYPISLGQAVYGGTLEVETGLLTVTHGVKIYDGTENWSTEYTYNFYSGTGRGSGSQQTDYQCSHWKYNNILGNSTDTSKMPSAYISESGNFNVQRADISHTGADMKQWCLNQYQNGTPLTVVFRLNTPQTYQLTPVQVKTLLGYNNIWTDSGTVEVQYLANIGLYIQKIIGATEDDMTANQNISANKYFFVGEELYYSTSAISAGQTIVVGTNCIKTNLADALNALNS